MSWTKEEIKEMTGVLMRRAHGDGRDRQEVETICLLAETSIMNRESCERLMDKVEELKTDHAAEVEKLEAYAKEKVQQIVEERAASHRTETADLEKIRTLEERVRVLEEAILEFMNGRGGRTHLGSLTMRGMVCPDHCEACKLTRALAKPQPCKRCGDTGEVSEYNRVNPYSGPCPDCQPQQKEGE